MLVSATHPNSKKKSYATANTYIAVGQIGAEDCAGSGHSYPARGRSGAKEHHGVCSEPKLQSNAAKTFVVCQETPSLVMTLWP